MKKYFITGLLIWIPLVITLWVLKLVVDTLDQSLLLLPHALRTESWLGIHVPGMGVLLTLLIVLFTGVARREFDRPAPGAFLARDSAPHPGGEFHLFQRQAGERHAVFLQRRGVPQGAAGAVAARGHVDHRLSYRRARRRRHPAPAGRLRQRLCADHAQPDRRLLRDDAAQGRDRTRHERGRRAEIRDLHGRGRAERQRQAKKGNADADTR